jgi:glucose/arabinose dehydrogenase
MNVLGALDRPSGGRYILDGEDVAALDADGTLWTVEHGARGGDEVNRPEPGANHGWPVISYGRHYSGARIGVGAHREGMAQPLFFWDPSIAPSGMAFVSGAAFPGWRGSLFLAGLNPPGLTRLATDRPGN